MDRKLYRSESNKIIAGVCGGLSEYLNIDPSLIRLIWIFSVIFAGFGVLLYIAAWIVIPPEPVGVSKAKTSHASSNIFPLIIGLILILIGLAALAHNFGWTHWYYFNWHFFRKAFWIIVPTIFILLGVLMILRSTTKSSHSGADNKMGIGASDKRSGIAPEEKTEPKAQIKSEAAYSKASSAKETKDTKTEEKGKKKTGRDEGKNMNYEESVTGERKILYRDMENRMISGVCSGLSKYLDIDMSIIRLVWVLLTIFSFGLGILAYIVMVFIVPVKKQKRV